MRIGKTVIRQNMVSRVVNMKRIKVACHYRMSKSSSIMRYEEGYDLMNSQYLQWLELHHPDSVRANKDIVIPVDLNQQSLADMFSFVIPSSPVTVNDTESLTGNSHTPSLSS